MQKTLWTPHKKLLELINEFSNVAGYKINIQKSVEFLYTNKISERKSKKQSLLKVHLKKKKKKKTSLGINLNKEVKDLYTEKYKTLILKN